jgi:hypothetical protein
MTALAVQWVGFTSLWLADVRATSAGWSEFFQFNLLIIANSPPAPQWYSQYRFYLSVLVGTWLVLMPCPVSCLIILLSIIGTLAGTSALGPVAGHSETTHTLERIRADRALHHAETEGEIGGEIEAVSTGEFGDSYVKVQKLGGQEEGTEEDAPAEGEEGEEGATAEGGDENDSDDESKPSKSGKDD